MRKSELRIRIVYPTRAAAYIECGATLMLIIATAAALLGASFS